MISFRKIRDRNTECLRKEKPDERINAADQKGLLINGSPKPKRWTTFMGSSNSFSCANIDGATNHWSGLKATEKAQQQYNVGGASFQEWPICALCFYELTIHSDGSVSLSMGIQIFYVFKHFIKVYPDIYDSLKIPVS